MSLDDRQVGTPDGNLVLDLWVLDNRVGDLIRIALEGTGVRPAEFGVYDQLGMAALTPRELQSRLAITPSTMTGYLRALDRRGHIERQRQADGRSYRVELTESGRATLETCRRGYRRMLTRLRSQLPLPEPEIRRVLAAVDEALTATIEG